MCKLWISLAAVTMAALVLSACGGSASTPESQPAATAVQPAQSDTSAAATAVQPAQSDTSAAATAVQPAQSDTNAAAPTDATTTTAMSGGMNHDANAMSDNSYDVHFIDSILAHHAGVIAMAEEALKMSQNVALKDLAQKSMVTAQQEMDQLKSWRTQWHPNAAVMTDTMTNMGTMDAGMDMSMPFDQHYVEAMVAHHQGSIAMAKEAQTQAAHEELKAFAKNMVTEEEAEIAQLMQLGKQ